MFTSTRSFVAQFLPPQCTAGTHPDAAAQQLGNLGKSFAGSCNKMAGSSSAVKKPNSKAYLSLLWFWMGAVAWQCVSWGSQAFYLSPPSLGIMQLRRRPIGLKSAFYPGSDRFIGDEQKLVPTWEKAGTQPGGD